MSWSTTEITVACIGVGDNELANGVDRAEGSLAPPPPPPRGVGVRDDILETAQIQVLLCSLQVSPLCAQSIGNERSLRKLTYIKVCAVHNSYPCIAMVTSTKNSGAQIRSLRSQSELRAAGFTTPKQPNELCST